MTALLHLAHARIRQPLVHVPDRCVLPESEWRASQVCAWRQVVAAATAAAEQLGASHARLVSRAYHDALFMAQVRLLHACLHIDSRLHLPVLQAVPNFPSCMPRSGTLMLGPPC